MKTDLKPISIDFRKNKKRTSLIQPPPIEQPSESRMSDRGISLITKWWNNQKFQTKLTVFLLTGITIPVIAITQGMVKVAHDQAIQGFQDQLEQELELLETTIAEKTGSLGEESRRLSRLVGLAKVNPNNSKNTPQADRILRDFTADEVEESIHIITDSEGRSVAQKIGILDEDFTQPPSLPDNTETKQEMREISRPRGIPLGNIPIVQEALRTGQPLSGVELIKGEELQSLGLAEQANIGVKENTNKNLPEKYQSSPENTYDIDQGKAGLFLISVNPIKVNNKVVGAAIVGTLINRNYNLVDEIAGKIRDKDEKSTATIFAQDWRVSTNVPLDQTTRAIGTRATRQVAEQVLDKQIPFLGETKILGTSYLGAYHPLYNHQKKLNPAEAKPIGMTYVGKSLQDIGQNLNRLTITGYALGGITLALALLVTPLVAGTFSEPLQNLARFARRIGSGEKDIRLPKTERQDEIGILTNELNEMVNTIENDLDDKRHEAEQIRLLAEISRISIDENPSNLVKQFLELTRQKINSDRVVIYRINANGNGYISSEAMIGKFPSALALKIEDDCISQDLINAYKNGRVLANSNVFKAGFHPDHLQLMRQLAIKSNLITPIINGNDLYGLLIAHHCQQFHDWDSKEIEYFKKTASQIGVALTAVELLEQQKLEAQRDRQEKEDIQNELLKLLGEFETVSQGDLTVRADIGSGEIGIIADFFNFIIESLRDIVTQVKDTTTTVNISLNQDEKSMQQLAEQSRRNAKKIQQMLEFIEQMETSITQVAENARSAINSTKQASQTALAGEQAMDETVDTILQLRSTVSETARKVQRLGDASQQIAKVIVLINEISLKTNLLAVNASIEAARAGEEGRGFAVVAAEVGQLAAQSVAATKEIEYIVKTIQRGTREVVDAMEVGTTQVVEGTSKVEEAKNALLKIIDESRQIDQLVQSISEATVSQTKTSEMVTKFMEEIVKASEKTAESSQEVSQSLQKTVDVAAQLKQSVETFKVNEHS